MNKILVVLLLALTFGANAQRKSDHLYLQGSVLGYSYNPKTTIFKKDQIDLEGSLKGVKVRLLSDGKSIKSQTTNTSGEFSFFIPLGKTYELSYSKSGYGTSVIDLDLTSIPEAIAEGGVHLSNFELLLNSYDSKKPADNGVSYGKIYYDNAKKRFLFKAYEFDRKEALFKKLEDNAPVNILKTSLSKNDNLNKKPFSSSGTDYSDDDFTVTDSVEEAEINASNINIKELINSHPSYSAIVKSKFNEITNWDELTEEDLSIRATEIDKALAQLQIDKESAVTETDFLLIEIQEQQLKSAQNQLEAAQLYIDEQEAKLKAKNAFNYALIGIIVIVLALAFVLFKRYKEKIAINKELAAKNKKITDSINYAQRIQRSVLLAPVQVKEILPESFIYYQPLHIVSGDFYWISKVKNKVVFAAIDCTGHGVPGAFMSMIANTLMNKIIIEQEITNPGKILQALHEGVVKALHQEEDEYLSQDGMDMSICVMNPSANKLKFAGAMNGGYIVRNGEIIQLEPTIHGVGGFVKRRKKREIDFEVTEMDLLKNDMIYLFSDGYMDQFGGNDGEKFNLTRFKNVLLSISEQSADDQKIALETVLKQWKGEHPQIDDILVMGVRN